MRDAELRLATFRRLRPRWVCCCCRQRRWLHCAYQRVDGGSHNRSYPLRAARLCSHPRRSWRWNWRHRPPHHRRSRRRLPSRLQGGGDSMIIVRVRLLWRTSNRSPDAANHAPLLLSGAAGAQGDVGKVRLEPHMAGAALADGGVSPRAVLGVAVSVAIHAATGLGLGWQRRWRRRWRQVRGSRHNAERFGAANHTEALLVRARRADCELREVRLQDYTAAGALAEARLRLHALLRRAVKAAVLRHGRRWQRHRRGWYDFGGRRGRHDRHGSASAFVHASGGPWS
mmetsp:Transcript_101803/g.287167  ORF Transcript_101803/g.287167 Transcript_101803/m.287167 type:complete len:285 (-) Transcript_101803:1382-2236(-)